MALRRIRGTRYRRVARFVEDALLSPHYYSRMEPANNAGLMETSSDCGPGRIIHRRDHVTPRGWLPLPGILSLQAGIATGQVSPDYSRALRE
jgi:hypothetical protein